MELVPEVSITGIGEEGLVKEIKNKQLFTFLVPIVIGGFMLFGTMIVKVFGLIFIAFAIFVYIRYTDKVLVRIYKETLVIYNTDDQTQGVIIPWNQIETWELTPNSAEEDSIMIETTNNELAIIRAFGSGRITREIEHRAPGTNRRKKTQEQNNQGNSLFEAFKHFTKRK